MNYIIFGGSGFIGTHLIHLLKDEVVKEGDKIYDLDIVMPGEEGVVPGVVERNKGVEYIRLDVRKPIEFDFIPTENDIIFNLAAVHRTPGHPDIEYFETNILGAENVTAFAEKYGIKKILFTSSIAPYGAAEELKRETTVPTPNMPYGISKLVAEKIHEKWQVQDKDRELTIVRPGVVFGKVMCKLTKGKVNPLIGSAGVSAVPMAARVSQKVGAEYDPTNFLLMHAMGPNVAGVIGTAVAAGTFMAIFGVF